MQNTLQYYERNYDRIQDFLSYIGGISSIVLKIISISSLLIHNFNIILDTEELKLNSEQKNIRISKLLKNQPCLEKLILPCSIQKSHINQEIKI